MKIKITTDGTIVFTDVSNDLCTLAVARALLRASVDFLDTVAKIKKRHEPIIEPNPNRPEHVLNSGETTGLIYKAIGAAILARGAEVEFKDHDKILTAAYWAYVIQSKVNFNELAISVFDRKGRVFLKSLHNPAVKLQSSQA